MKTLAIAGLIFSLLWCSQLSAQATSPTHDPFPLFVKVQLDSSVKLSSLKAGESVEGKLTRDVFSPENRVFVSGSQIQLKVARVERKRKTLSGKWPWAAKIFIPHHENFPVFNNAAISMPDGTKSEIQASLLFSNRSKDVVPPSRNHDKKSKTSASIDANSADARSGNTHSGPRRPVLYLEAYRNTGETLESSEPTHADSISSIVLPAGTVCRVLLMEDVSASKNHVGDEIHARLLEPIVSDSHIAIPVGSLFVGRVIKAVRPRIPSRAGSLTIAFDSVQLAEGHHIPLSASLASVSVDTGSPLKMDREGRLHGSRPGALWMLINGGVAGGIAKEVDDGTQLLVEALISTATDASTAGTARIAGSVVSGLYLLTRKGHDVVLPNHTEMGITLNRPLTITAEPAKFSSFDGKTVSATELSVR